MLHTRNLAGTIEIDGRKFDWELLREPQWCSGDGWRGMMVALRQQDSQREALLEFPMPRGPGNGSPQRRRPKLTDAIIANGVHAALSAGWDPYSRGRPVVFMVDANGC